MYLSNEFRELAIITSQKIINSWRILCLDQKSLPRDIFNVPALCWVFIFLRQISSAESFLSSSLLDAPSTSMPKWLTGSDYFFFYLCTFYYKSSGTSLGIIPSFNKAMGVLLMSTPRWNLWNITEESLPYPRNIFFKPPGCITT